MCDERGWVMKGDYRWREKRMREIEERLAKSRKKKTNEGWREGTGFGLFFSDGDSFLICGERTNVRRQADFSGDAEHRAAGGRRSRTHGTGTR